VNLHKRFVGLHGATTIMECCEDFQSRLPGRPELAEFIATAPTFDAAVLLTGDRFAGMLAGTRNNGQGAGLLNAVVIAPEFQGGWGWACTMVAT